MRKVDAHFLELCQYTDFEFGWPVLWYKLVTSYRQSIAYLYNKNISSGRTLLGYNLCLRKLFGNVAGRQKLL